MADISSFPTIHDVLEFGDNIIPLNAGGTIKAGQAVVIEAAGTSKTVIAADATPGQMFVGVALYDASSGDVVAVCTTGCVVEVANYDDTTAIDAGEFVETNDNTVGGTVGAVDTSDSGGATVTTHDQVIGISLEDIPGDGTGKIMVTAGLSYTQENAS